jgi:hypothetical protein
MGKPKMLAGLTSVHWPSIPQPPWNVNDTVPSALQYLSSCVSELDCRQAYDRLLYAFGNNHAGTYYPVVLAALPFLAEVLDGAGPWARIATLEVLIELSTSFAPEQSYERILTPDGDSKELRGLLREGVQRILPLVGAIASADNLGQKERELAAELSSLTKYPD